MLWTRACPLHKGMTRKYADPVVMACIIRGKRPEQLDPYEDQLIITEAYARAAEDSYLASQSEPDRGGVPIRDGDSGDISSPERRVTLHDLWEKHPTRNAG